MVDIAKDAGAAIMAELASAMVIDEKGDASPVTNADKAADAIIKARLRQLTPHIPIVSEEDTPQEREAVRNSSLRWVIDPLDGTKTAIAYANGQQDHNQFGVHIGLVQGNTPIAGVAYFPAMAGGQGVVYYTGDDHKAYKQVGDAAPRQIHVSKPPFKAGILRAAVHAHEERRPQTIAGRNYHPVIGVGGQRICLVAEGSVDVADMNDIPQSHRGQYAYRQWDESAAHAILRAAGGELVSQHDCEPVTYDDPEYKMPGAIAGGINTLKFLGVADLPALAGSLKR